MKKCFLILLVIFASCKKDDSNSLIVNNNTNVAASDASVKYEILGDGNFDIIISTSSKSDGYVGLSSPLPFSYTMTYANGDNYSFQCTRQDFGISMVYVNMYLNGTIIQQDSLNTGGVTFSGIIQ